MTKQKVRIRTQTLRGDHSLQEDLDSQEVAEAWQHQTKRLLQDQRTKRVQWDKNLRQLLTRLVHKTKTLAQSMISKT